VGGEKRSIADQPLRVRKHRNKKKRKEGGENLKMEGGLVALNLLKYIILLRSWPYPIKKKGKGEEGASSRGAFLSRLSSLLREGGRKGERFSLPLNFLAFACFRHERKAEGIKKRGKRERGSNYGQPQSHPTSLIKRRG